MIQGKKQVDIRENNKSAVISILLEKEMSLMEMATRMKLSHTALIKVTRELLEQNLIFKKDTVVLNFGRPSAIYDINPSSAIASCILISNSKIEIYFVDMKGYQVNNIAVKNKFDSVKSLCAFLDNQSRELMNHPRIVNQTIHYLYIGLPSQGMYGMDFHAIAEAIKHSSAKVFTQATIKVERDIDLILAGESKYGVMKHFNGNAIVLKIDKDIIASLMFSGRAYSGDSFQQGQFGDDEKCFTLKALKDALSCVECNDVLKLYQQGDQTTIETVHDTFVRFSKNFGNIIKFLDINKIVLSGEIVGFGEPFLNFCQDVLKKYNPNVTCEYVVLGLDAFRAGAVWLTTYHTLKEIVLRKQLE